MAVIIKKERKYRHGNKTGYLFIHILWSVIKIKRKGIFPPKRRLTSGGNIFSFNTDPENGKENVPS